MSTAAAAGLWLAGPPAVGKSTVGWALYSRLRREGVAVGFVDVDQLGMCYPPLAADPDRYRMKARNAGGVAEEAGAAGARCLVVAGVVDPVHGVLGEDLTGSELLVFRLRVDRGELRRRMAGRGASQQAVRSVLREADALDAGAVGEMCLDTTGLTAPEVVRAVEERTDGWRAAAVRGASGGGSPAAGQAGLPVDKPVLWLCGATGVGKSTVGFAAYQRVLRAGVTAAYVDLDQIGFCHPARADDPGNHRLKARNLAALWRNYRAAGAQRLIVVGPVENEAALEAYAGVLPVAGRTVCRLHAGYETLVQRVLSRGDGGSWLQPGDPLRGRHPAFLARIAEEAAATADALERAGLGDLRVATDQYTADQIAETILIRAAWPR